MSEPLHVFGYGSLMYEPACPDWLQSMEDATLPGWRRAFNKRSVPRGCAEAEALLAEGVPGWMEAGRRVSLCLGLEPSDAGVAGKLLTYPAQWADEVRAELDRREGVRDDRDPLLNGYERRMLAVQTGGGVQRALVYVTRVGSVMYAPGLSVAETAEVLCAATPRVRGERALGAEYLMDAVDVVRRVGMVDVGLEALRAVVVARVGVR